MANKSSDNEVVTKGYFKQELSKELSEFRSKIMEVLDKVMKELVTIRQEQSAHFLQHERIDEKLGDHEKRIMKIESHQFA